MGLIYLALVMIFPRVMVPLVFFLAFVTLLAAGIVMLVQPIKLLERTGSVWNIVIGVLLIITALAVVIFYFCHRREISLAGIFMYYANVFLKENFSLFLYIPLFLIWSFGLVVLCVWQYVAFGTMSSPTWTAGDVYKRSYQNVFLQVLNLIEFIWGIQFIRDSCTCLITQSTTSSQEVRWSGTSTTTRATATTAAGPSSDTSAGTSAQ